ncbi:MAG: NAD(P)/FAD-dependent oxidoreductase [Myxococcales bacterium]|nr:NAD(P)/FAD-dependent oxidoreductase [Myxococcales bacterium]
MRARTSSEPLFPVIVVGLGPAGAAALSELARQGIAALGIGDEPVGGLVRAARRIDNLPALGRPAPGAALARRLARHLQDRKARLQHTRVVRIERDGIEFLCTDDRERSWRARCVILATGTRPLPWVPAVAGNWLHRDARTLPRDLRGTSVVVVGGGEAALDTALSAADRGARVKLLLRSDRLRAPAPLVREARRAGVRVMAHQRVRSVHAAPGAVRIFTEVAGRQRRVRCHHLAVCIGRAPARELISGLAPDVSAELAVAGLAPGLFLAGDVRGRGLRFCAQALADGQAAAQAACAYLDQPLAARPGVASRRGKSF